MNSPWKLKNQLTLITCLHVYLPIGFADEIAKLLRKACKQHTCTRPTFLLHQEHLGLVGLEQEQGCAQTAWRLGLLCLPTLARYAKTDIWKELYWQQHCTVFMERWLSRQLHKLELGYHRLKLRLIPMQTCICLSSNFQIVPLKDSPSFSPILDLFHSQSALSCREFHLCSRTARTIYSLLWLNIWKTQWNETENIWAEITPCSASLTQRHGNSGPILFQIICRTDTMWEQISKIFTYYQSQGSLGILFHGQNPSRSQVNFLQLTSWPSSSDNQGMHFLLLVPSLNFTAGTICRLSSLNCLITATF